MFDAHLHSLYSDGSLSVPDLVKEVAGRGISGFALTDHNGLWGLNEARAAAAARQLLFLEGCEISAMEAAIPVHLLAFSHAFLREVLEQGLEGIRQGYEGRIRAMVEGCQQAGYQDISFDRIVARRLAQQDAPVLISTDVARELRDVYQLSFEAARALTTFGGACYIPYGNWAPPIAAVASLVENAGGRIFLAHPGLTAHDEGEAVMWEILEEAKGVVAGVEVYHPAHSERLSAQLELFCRQHGLAVCGGSDWHGPNQGPGFLGSVGLSERQRQDFFEALS